MAVAEETLVKLGNHAGFRDWLKRWQYILMSYLLVFPFLAIAQLHDHRLGLREFSLGGLVFVLAGLVLLALTALFVQVELVLDRERQQLLIRRKLLGFTQLKSLASIEELWKVVVAGEIPHAPVNYFWKYVPVIITRSGGRYRAGGHEDDHLLANERGRSIAEELEIDYSPAQEYRRLVVTPGATEPRCRQVPFPLRGLDGLTVLFWGVTLTVTPALALALLSQ